MPKHARGRAWAGGVAVSQICVVATLVLRPGEQGPVVGVHRASLRSLFRVSGPSMVSPRRGLNLWNGRRSMNRNEFGAHRQPYASHGVQHREIGLRAVAAAILYQGG